MNAEEIYDRIMAAIKANPDCRHVKDIRNGQVLIIMGRYGYVARPFCYFNNTTNTWRISDCIHNHFCDLNNTLERYISTVISYIKTETKPITDFYRAQRKFYEDNFPCLAAEVDYSLYLTPEYDDINMRVVLHGTESLEQVCPELSHWDLLAFERKVHAALDGILLPLPIRNEIFSLFTY